MISLSAMVTGYLLDLWLGDPPHWPHPVRWIGNLINLLQRHIRRWCHSERALKIGGVILWFSVVGMTYAVTWGLLYAASSLLWLHWLVEVWLIYTLLATRCLKDAAIEVWQALQTGSLDESRRQLSYIVGRDTRQLQPPQMVRATVETVAENTVDAVIAPLLFLAIGGAPLAMAYKAINTLDSMVGYMTPKYRAIGFFSAKLDDFANYIPARLSWLLLSLAARLLRFDYQQALRIGWRDRYQHKSPNCAWPEATVAGALGIRLGGPNLYFGELVEKPWIGDLRREVRNSDITDSIRLMYTASALTLLIAIAIRLLL